MLNSNKAALPEQVEKEKPRIVKGKDLMQLMKARDQESTFVDPGHSSSAEKVV